MSRSILESVGKKFRIEGISSVVKKTVISPIKEMELLVSEMKNVISLAQGKPSFNTPKHISNAAIKAIRENKVSKYSINLGIIDFRKIISKKLKKDNKIKANISEIMVTVGAIEAVAEALLTVINVGDEVILFTPGYSSHIEQVNLAGGKKVFVPLVEEENYRLDIDKVEKSISKKTKAILVNTPSNPTGAVFKKSDLKKLADLAIKNNIFIITDETYEYIVFDDEKHFSMGSIKELKNNYIGVFSLSKSYAMTGWRVGYAVSEEGIINQMLKLHDSSTICCPTVCQYAGMSALDSSQDCVEKFRIELQKRRDITYKRLRETSLFSAQKPKGAYYIFPRVLDGKIDSFDFSLKLLREAKVAVVPGGAFGPTGKGHVRFCYGTTTDQINEAFDRLEKFERKNYNKL